MATEKRMIYADVYKKVLEKWESDASATHDWGVVSIIEDCIWELDAQPTVDAVPVDEIRVDILKISIENQETVLNISICGKPNEVKVPFCKEVAEVVHGHNTYDHDSAFECSVCGWSDWDTMTGDGKYNYCPNCGAKMDKTENQ